MMTTPTASADDSPAATRPVVLLLNKFAPRLTQAIGERYAALGGSAESWLHMQATHDLWRAERTLRHAVTKIEPLKHAA